MDERHERAVLRRTEDQAAAIAYALNLFERDVQDIEASGIAGSMLGYAAERPIRFQRHSPLAGDTRYFGDVHLDFREYPVPEPERCRLMWASVRTGVVAPTEHGWLYLRDAVPGVLREATEVEVEMLPRLPAGWEAHVPEGEIEDHAAERAAFLRLLAPYELRDGHDPAQPYTAPRDHVGRGWFGVVKELVEDLVKLGWNREVLQVKEKFGTLRFYVTQRDEALLDRIAAATEHSGEICERCGKGGSARPSELVRTATRCDRCWTQERWRRV